MLKYLIDFKENIEGLRDFVELIKPVLRENREKVFERHKQDLLPLGAAYALLSDDFTIEDKQKLISTYKEKYDAEFQIEEGENNSKSITLKLGDKKNPEFNFALSKLKRSGKQEERLYVSTLISLLSTVEWFLSQILHFYFDKYPGASGINKKSLTLEEIKRFDVLKDAENYLIDDKIEQILRGSFSDWLSILKTDLKLNMGYINDFSDELTEIFQRRNILVHNGGIVNSIYLALVSQDLRKNLKLGDEVVIDESYLEKAISQLHLIFSLIACELWKHIEPENDERANFLMNLGYDYLLSENRKFTQAASTFLINDKKMPFLQRTIAQLNYWLSKIMAGEQEEIQVDMNSADFSDKSQLLQVALHSLRGEKKEFFEKIPQVLANDELTVERLFEFPIFKFMRETEEFENLCKSNVLLIEYLESKGSK